MSTSSRSERSAAGPRQPSRRCPSAQRRRRPAARCSPRVVRGDTARRGVRDSRRPAPHRRPGRGVRRPAGMTGDRRGRIAPEPAARRFAYYERLTRAQQRIYRQSDDVTRLALPGASRALHPLVAGLDAALRSEDRPAVQLASQHLFTGLTRAFAVGPCRVEVLAARPHNRWGELQGLYNGRPPPAARPAVDAHRAPAPRRGVPDLSPDPPPRGLGHHLDYRYLKLADSFHTQGFYQRESSLFHQLVPEARFEPSPPPAEADPRSPP